jgi:hypothetical protein
MSNPEEMTMDFDFATNQTVESLDTVPETFRGLYQEVTEGDNAGRFTVAEGAKGLVAAYSGLAKNAAGLRQEKKAASDESAQRRHALKSVEDTLSGLGVEIGEEGIGPAVEAFVTDLQEKVKGGSALKVDLDKIKQQFSQQEQTIRSETQQELETMLGSLRKHMVSASALGVPVKHKGSPELLLPHVERHADVVKDDNGEYVVRVKDADGSVRLNAQGDPMSIDDLVVEMKTKDAFARAFESEVPGGTGSTPGSMQRPAPRSNNRENMSAVEKIGAGLAKGQHKTSSRAGTAKFGAGA